MQVTKRYLFWLLCCLCPCDVVNSYDYKGYDKNANEEERFHDPHKYTPAPFLNANVIDGSDYTVPSPLFTPDYRFPEPPRYPKYTESRAYYEYNRPYRLSPSYILKAWGGYFWSAKYYQYEEPEMMCCYCTTVFKRMNVLATCAVLTTRHILTTASSTEMVLKLYPKQKTLENLLGAWYESNEKKMNTSYYMTPARIHFHPQYLGIDNVNMSHPLPLHDLALWASTFRFYGTQKDFQSYGIKTCICNRADAHKYETVSGTPKPGDEFWVVGYQWIRAYKRRPRPFFKYGLRTRDVVIPCPKLEWGWHFCLGGQWAPMGVESGTILHRFVRKASYTYSGLLGMAGFSMKLRSKRLTHYFQVINTHPNLEFLYNAYNGRIKNVFLDHRFFDTKNKSPQVKPWFYVPWVNPTPSSSDKRFYYGGSYNIY